MQKICHKLVAETAKAIAAEVYEVLAGNNRFFKQYPTMKKFINSCWGDFIGDARKSLAVMLRAKPNSDPRAPVEYYYSQHIRDEIEEALIQEGEMKSAPEVDLNQLRIQAGMDPLARPLPGMQFLPH